jgi:hypothetical protein
MSRPKYRPSNFHQLVDAPRADSEFTRVVRLRADTDPARAPNSATCRARTVEFSGLVPPDPRPLFTHHQARLHQICREYPKPGVVVFGVHPRSGLAGHLWLEASDKLRAGTIGRHCEVDLFLDDDEQLSLRHLLLLVKRSDTGLTLRVVDLATPSGFQAEEGGTLRAVEANGTLILRAAGYWLFIFPTGTAPPWDPRATDPWETLPPRVRVADERPEHECYSVSEPNRDDATRVRFREAPSQVGFNPLLGRGELSEGQLILSANGVDERLAIGPRALSRGVILGRYARCSGELGMGSDLVSRVHAIVLRCDGVLHIIDAGSTNGIVRGDEDVRCEPVRAGAKYVLGKMRVRWLPKGR